MKQQISFRLGEKDYEVKPDFDTLERIEQRFPLLEFLASVQANKVKFSNVAWVLYSALNASGEKISYSEVGNLVMEDLPTASVHATQIVSEMLGSGPEKPIKKK